MLLHAPSALRAFVVGVLAPSALLVDAQGTFDPAATPPPAATAAAGGELARRDPRDAGLPLP